MTARAEPRPTPDPTRTPGPRGARPRAAVLGAPLDPRGARPHQPDTGPAPRARWGDPSPGDGGLPEASRGRGRFWNDGHVRREPCQTLLNLVLIRRRKGGERNRGREGTNLTEVFADLSGDWSRGGPQPSTGLQAQNSRFLSFFL